MQRRSHHNGRTVEDESLTRTWGSGLLTGITVLLLLPAEGAAVVFTLAIATGQSPFWPTVEEAAWLLPSVLGFFAGIPLLATLRLHRIPDAIRWILLDLLVAGLVPSAGWIALGLVVDSGTEVGQLTPIPGTDILIGVVILAWLWAIPALGLLGVRRFGVGRPLPPLRAFAQVFVRDGQVSRAALRRVAVFIIVSIAAIVFGAIGMIGSLMLCNASQEVCRVFSPG